MLPSKTMHACCVFLQRSPGSSEGAAGPCTFVKCPMQLHGDGARGARRSCVKLLRGREAASSMPRSHAQAVDRA
eukprot:430981-Pleurochrysis_carterae.AAC.1